MNTQQDSNQSEQKVLSSPERISAWLSIGSKRVSVFRLFLLLTSVLVLLGCNGKDKEGKERPKQDCKASVIFEEVIVIRDTDPAPINDKWDIEAQVLPQFPPNPGAFTKIANGQAGDQGVRLVQNFVFVLIPV